MTDPNDPNKPTKVVFRPYARLLTMLGDQLIKDEKIALIELIKNSYDADADWVQVRFGDFNLTEKGLLEATATSFIELEDNGEGMTAQTIEKSWMNPATPSKLTLKNDDKSLTPRKKRVIQGEKGIGRFSMLKLGNTIEITSKSIKSTEDEVYVKIDLSAYDEDFYLKTDGDKKTNTPAFLDELKFDLIKRPSAEYFGQGNLVVRGEKVKRGRNGTCIKITNLKGDWSRVKLEKIYEDITKLQSPFHYEKNKKGDAKEFIVDLVAGTESILSESSLQNKLTTLFDKAILNVQEGRYDAESQTVKMKINGKLSQLSIERFRGIKHFDQRFLVEDDLFKKDNGSKKLRSPECGSFGFTFYVFDFSHSVSGKHRLEKAERDIVREHRIYLYRDGVRVYPYGDPQDDWLQVDILRGITKASFYLSNDQTVGWIDISHKENPQLKDKTSREGLLELGNGFSDFVVLIQTILSEIHKQYKAIKVQEEQAKTIGVLSQNKISTLLGDLLSHLKKKSDSIGAQQLEEIKTIYQKERDYLIQRIDVTEDLAAVGLSVETTAHDVISAIARIRLTLNYLASILDKGDYPPDEIRDKVHLLQGQITFVEDVLEGIKPIFRSTKRKSKNLDVEAVFQQIRRFYQETLASKNIDCDVEIIAPALTVKSTEAVLMQTFINLFDNAIYWLDTIDKKNKKIKVTIDGKKMEVAFSDNGPGVSADDLPLIFEPFYSSKGDEGRGLGLYIARQLLSRYDYKISCVAKGPRAVLSGANFLITFRPTED